MCFVVLLGALLPRVTLALLYLFTGWLHVIQPQWLVIAGFLLLPYTTLAFVAIHHYSGNVSSDLIPHMVIMLVAVLLDFGAWGGGHRHYRRRRYA